MLHQRIGRSEAVSEEALLASYEPLTIDQMFQRCVDYVCELTGWAVGHVYVPREKSHSELIPALIWHFRHAEKFDMLRQVTQALRFTKGVGLPGRVYDTGKSSRVSDIRNAPAFTRGRLALDLGLQAAFAFPVMGEKGTIAVFEFFSVTTQPPEPSVMETIDRVCAELGSCIDRKRVEKMSRVSLQ